MQDLGLSELSGHVPLAAATTLELGGPARYFTRARSEAALIRQLAWASKARVPVLILGSGSNVVISDAGFDGLVIQVRLRRVTVRHGQGHTSVTAGAGVPLDDIVRWSVDHELSGAECLAGIPGTCGAAPVQNVGAYGQDVGGIVDSVDAINMHTLEHAVFRRAQCQFRHRDSMFKRNASWVIVRVVFRFEHGFRAQVTHPEILRALGKGSASPLHVYRAVLGVRKMKSMVIDASDPNRRSVGSFFIGPSVEADAAERLIEKALSIGAARSRAEVPVYELPDGRRRFAGGWLVEAAGFRKGERRGSVGISTKHALSLVHLGGGSTCQLVSMAREIQGRVHDLFEVRMEPEPTHIGIG